MKVRFFECKEAEDMEIKINNWAELNKREIISVSITTKIVYHSHYIIACVVYK